MKKALSEIAFIQPAVQWGIILGLITGVVYFFFYALSFYGVLGIPLSIIAAVFISLANGMFFSVVTYYFALGNARKYRISMLITSIIVTFLAGQITYFLIFAPFGGGIEGTLTFALPPTFVAIFIAIYASQKVAVHQITHKKKD
jgi:hypothetical protein